jgi:hypothetical protein
VNIKRNLFVLLACVFLLSAFSLPQQTRFTEKLISGAEESFFNFCDDMPCVGYQYKEIEVSAFYNSYQITEYVPLPLGANPNNVLPLCLIHTYQTDSDDDIGWHCTHYIEYLNGLPWMRFDLALIHAESNYASIGATALVLDLAEFNLLDYYQFTAYDDQNLSSHNLYSSNDSFDLVEVNTYETNSDDDFFFLVAGNSHAYPSNYIVNVFNGNSGSYIQGGVYVLTPVNDKAMICQGDIHIENSDFYWASNEDIVEPSDCVKPPYNLDQEEVVVASLTIYNGHDMDFEVVTNVFGTYISGQYWFAEGYGGKGNDESSARLDLTLIGYED